MSQPNVHVQEGDTNISLGSNSSVMSNSGNLVIGFGKDQSRNLDNSLSDRMDGTDNAIVIGNGYLKGVEVGTTTERTSVETKVPDRCILIGNNASIPTDVNGLADSGTTDGHIIIGSSDTDGDLFPPGGVVNGGIGTVSIPLWYNGVRYVLQANVQASIPP